MKGVLFLTLSLAVLVGFLRFKFLTGPKGPVETHHDLVKLANLLTEEEREDLLSGLQKKAFYIPYTAPSVNHHDSAAFGIYHKMENGTCPPMWVLNTDETACILPSRFDVAMNFAMSGGRKAWRYGVDHLGNSANYLRETLVYGEESEGAVFSKLMEHPALVEAARQMAAREWGLGDSSRVVVEPSVLFLNLMLPGQVLPTHTDVPTFLGATRKTGVPEWVLSSMLHSKLFADERVKVLTGVLYFGEEDWMAQQGGEIVVYLNGSSHEPTLIPPLDNGGVLLDTDVIYHTVDPVKPLPERRALLKDIRVKKTFRLVPKEPSLGSYDPQMVWVLQDENGQAVQELLWGDMRLSVSWKAYCFESEEERARWAAQSADLSYEAILDTFENDLRQRGALKGPLPLGERKLAELIASTYQAYPKPSEEANRFPYFNFCLLETFTRNKDSGQSALQGLFEALGCSF